MITRDQVHERKPHRFIAEASDIGLPPGEWPVQLPTDIGNGLPFVFQREARYEDDLAYVEYAQIAGCITLKIFND